MHKRLLACAIIAATSLVGAATFASAEETRAQHREWMRKFADPGGSLNGLISPQDAKIYRTDLLGCKSESKSTQPEISEAC
jgi:hypothetical protein